MGADDTGEVNERPRHEVHIEKSFYVAAHEVTFAQFRRFVSATRYKTQAEDSKILGQGFDSAKRDMSRPPRSPYTWRNTGFEQNDNSPVVNVSWHDAVAYCRWLSDKDGRAFRLPTEAEWEYVCRAGTETAYHWGNSLRRLSGRENFADQSLKLAVRETCPMWKHCESWNDRYTFTAPVGAFRPNAFGLYDMHGNVAEWCEDFYVEDRYLKLAGFRALDGKQRVYRGGSFFDAADTARSAKRRAMAPDVPLANIGFRVVMELK